MTISVDARTALAVRFDGVQVRYPGTVESALSNVSWEVEEGSFVLVAGRSGSGKSTLLRCLNGLVPHFSGGAFGGVVNVRGHDTRLYPPRALSRTVGFVFQDPEAQFVTDRVEDELAFGMEQLGVPPVTMRKRLEEVLDLLGIAALRRRDVSTLSGGERQRVAVAAALALHPAVLALDEPTSQLDPWGADDVLTALTRLNEDLGLTVVLAEHRLERVVGHVDRMLVLDRGQVAHDGSPRTVLEAIDPALTPPVVRLGRVAGWEPLPLTVKEGRVAARADARQPRSPAADPGRPGGDAVVSIQRLSAGYGRETVLRQIDLDLRPGELVAVMGRNGSGKTTLLRAIMGFHRPSAGRITVAGRDTASLDPADLARDVGYVPQNPTAMLFAETVRDELAFTRRQRTTMGVGAAVKDADALLAALDIADLADRHPRDLSVGERERVALAAILVGAPHVLLLDEPTRGMDYVRKQALADLLGHLRDEGVAIMMATHDVELVAAIATRVVLLGDSVIVADGTPREVLSGSLTFATQINKLYGDGFLTVEDVVSGLAESPMLDSGAAR